VGGTADGSLDSSPVLTVPTGSPFTTQIQAVTIGCSGYFDGGWDFRAQREQLAPAQRDRLADLRGVLATKGCVLDGIDCSLTFTQPAGTET
jgi:hypothetical protein